MALLSVVVAQFVLARIATRLGVQVAVALGMFLVAIGILVFSRIGPVADYVGVILPGSAIIGGLGMGIGYSALTMAAVMGVPNEEQGLAASIQTTSLQVGGGLGLAIVVAVVNSVTLSSTRNQTSSTIAAQLQGFHIGLYLITAFAVLGALVALVGIRESPGAPQVVGAGSSPVGTNACSSLNFNMTRAAGTLPTKTSTKPRT